MIRNRFYMPSFGFFFHECESLNIRLWIDNSLHHIIALHLLYLIRQLHPIQPNNNHNISYSDKNTICLRLFKLATILSEPQQKRKARPNQESRSLLEGTRSKAHNTLAAGNSLSHLQRHTKLILHVKTSYHKLCFYAWQRRGSTHNRRDPPGRLNERTLRRWRWWQLVQPEHPTEPTYLAHFSVTVWHSGRWGAH